jgi:hypothetical protein
MSGWRVSLGTRKLVVSLFVIGALVSGATSAQAGNGGLTMTVTPTTVTYDEEFTVSGTGCFIAEDSEGFVGVQVRGTELLEIVTPEPDGSWSTTFSISSGSGVQPGTLTVFAGCLPIELFYPEVEITLVASEPPTPSTEAPSSSTTEAPAAVEATTTPRFTG